MLEKFKNKKVEIGIAVYAKVIDRVSVGVKARIEYGLRRGTVTNIDENFIELDNNEIIAIKYVATIKSI